MAEAWQPVKLAAKVIGHISQGMYRTPAGAVKELISNAYDAGATYAKIHTGFPRFDFFSCEDDGTGISHDKFLELMNGGIGDSEKQSQTKRIGEYGRPVVGRLGVGLLSLAQICPRFSITSYHADTKEAFEAEIKFPPYSRQEIDKIIAEQKAGTIPAQPITHGEFKINKVEYQKGKHGITVTTSSLRESFRKTMSNLENLANKKILGSKDSYTDFDRYLKATVNPRLSSLSFASQYDQLIFGLALAAPLPYPECEHKEGADTVLTRIPELALLQNRLKSYSFRVEVDNMQLRRPVIFPSNKDWTPAADCVIPKHPKMDEFTLQDGSYEEVVQIRRYDIAVNGSDATFKLYWFEYDKKVNGYPLRFNGYIFLQTSRLFPKEYQGVLVRLRNVAIGQYDVNVMTYPQAEGPRFSMLSSEVFVEEGLDDALKVDRDGFNSLDPQYIRLQSFIHSILHELIFPGSWGEEKQRNRKRREEHETQVTRNFQSVLRKATGKNISRIEIVPRSEERASLVPVEIDQYTKAVRIYESNPVAKTILKRKKFRGVASRVIAAFEAANLERTIEKRREVFYGLIEGIFNE